MTETPRHAISGTLHPTLFPAWLHAIDISDMNSYDIVRPSLIGPVESDLMNHLHGLSTFWTSNNSKTWHRTCVDAWQSWQRPRGYRFYKQPANQPNKQTQYNSQTNGPWCKSVPICQGHSVWTPTPQGSLTKNTWRVHISLTNISFPITLIHAASYRFVGRVAQSV